MSSAPKLSFKANLIKSSKALLALVLLLVLREALDHWAGVTFRDNSLFGFGFLMVAGVFGGQLSASLGLPRITGFLGAGLVVGPSATGLLTYEQVTDLKIVNQLALALIALQAGSELTREMLANNFKKTLSGTFFHVLVIGSGMTAGLFFMREHIHFLSEFPPFTVALLAFLLASIAISKSPAAVVAVLSETKSRGPLTEYALGMVVLLDIFVLALFAFAMALAEPAVTGVGGMSTGVMFSLVEEMLLSVAAGTFFGFLIILFLKFINRERLLFLIVISYGVTALSNYLHYDTMLIFVIAGLVVTQFSSEAKKLISTIEDLSSMIMIIFFATAGASLHMEELQKLWKLAVFMFLLRAALTWVSEFLNHRKKPQGDVLKRYGATPFISQAGLTIGLATILQTKFPVVGAQLATLAIALVTLNEIFGPVLFKWGLSHAGEIPGDEKKS